MTSLVDLFDGEEETPPNVMFFDMSTIALAAALQEFPEQKIQVGMLRHIVLNSIKFNLKKFKADYPEVILCFDNAENGYWRRDYGYYYKKNRGEARKESAFDWQGYFDAINEIKKELALNMPYYTLDCARIEADDIIGVLTKLFTLQGRLVMIVASDGDYYQLHRFPGVKQWAPNLKKFVDKKKDGTPTEFLMTKVLKGDRKDNVAGIKCRSDYWYTRIDGERAPSISTKLIEACLDDGPEKHLTEDELKRYKENQIMIDMDYIPEDIQSQIITAYESFKVPGRNKIYPYFVSKKLTLLSRDLNQF